MAVKSPDLDQFRRAAAAVTGNPVGDFGMLPDPAHLSGGGYHCGLTDLIRIGKFHYPRSANVGGSTEDYSARQARDRNAIDDRCAAVDGPDDWPNGGRAAWIRHNNMVVRQMQVGDPELGALRAINYTPDGTALRRYDSLHPHDGPNGDGIIASTDTVGWHTHYEWWRDTLGTALMQRSLVRLLQIMRAAVRNVTLDVIVREETHAMAQALLVDGLAPDPTQVWLVDASGMWRRKVDRAWNINNDNYHHANLLGPLGNGGQVYRSAGNPDIWGRDIATLGAALSDAQVEAIAQRAAAAVVSRDDNPLSDADKPVLVAAFKQAAREGAV